MPEDIMMYVVASITQIVVWNAYMKEIIGLKRSMLWLLLCWGLIEYVGYLLGGFSKPMALVFRDDMTWETVVTVGIYVIVLQLLVWWMCKGTLKTKATFFWFYFIAYILIGYLLTKEVRHKTPYELFFATEAYGRDYVMVILVQVFMFMGIQFVPLLKEDQFRQKRNLKKMIRMIGLPIFFFIVLFVLSTRIVDDYQYHVLQDNYYQQVLFFVFIFFIYYYYIITMQDNKIEIERQIYAKQLGMYQEWYEGMKYTRNEVRAFRHDMNNHFSILRNLCDRAEQEDKMKESIAEIRNYIDRIGIHTTSSSYDTDSGNLILDAVIDLKKSYALSKGISFTTEVQVPEQMTYNNFDIVILLGNLLDNAIEACESSKRIEECRIVLQVKYKMGNMFIMIQNSYDGSRDGESGVVTDEITWMTTKRDFKNHGIGMKNVMNIVKKYDGVMKWEAKQGMFQMEMLLYEFVNTY